MMEESMRIAAASLLLIQVIFAQRNSDGRNAKQITQATDSQSATTPTPAKSPADTSNPPVVAPTVPAPSELPYAAGDYFACKFTKAELQRISAPDVAPTLSAADGEILKTRVITAAASADSKLTSVALQDFTTAIEDYTFTGLTPS